MTPLVVFDIDGTLADDSARQRAHQPWSLPHGSPEREAAWEAYYARMAADAPIPGMVDLAATVARFGRAVFATGRPSRYRWLTLDWLRRHVWKGTLPEDLVMRPEVAAWARTPNEVLKVDHHLRVIREVHGEPSLWVDDHPEVVRLLAAEGVRTLLVPNTSHPLAGAEH